MTFVHVPHERIYFGHVCVTLLVRVLSVILLKQLRFHYTYDYHYYIIITVTIAIILVINTSN